MSFMASTRRQRVVLGVIVFVGGGNFIAGKPDLAEGWRALSISATGSAWEIFKDSGASREAQLGASIALAQLSPVTPKSFAKALSQLEVLARGEDEIARAAKYHLGRLIQLSPFVPDPMEAARHFEQLLATGADDRWCQLALLKLAVLHLMVLPEPGGVEARLVKASSLFLRTESVHAKRDLHLIVAEVRLYHELDEAGTLAHLNAAAAVGGIDSSMHADLLIQQGQLSAAVGKIEAASAHYREFLRLYPKDSRRYTVQQALLILPDRL